MATRLPATRIDIRWHDITGSEGVTGCHRHSSEDVVAVHAAITSLCGRLETVSNAAIVEYTAKWRYHITDTRPTSGTTKNYGALFIFATATTDEYVMIEILGVSESNIVDGLIDITNADIITMIENIIDAGYCNPFGSVATSLIAAIPTFNP
jgi:hypothetical protein